MTVVALLSGGKESFYAAMIEYPIDYALFLVYEFPRPNPHLVNLGKSIEAMLNAGLRVLVARLRRGSERSSTVEILRRLGADKMVAGDVYIEDHLKYMESIASEAGVELREPLWGKDPEELLREEVEAGLVPLIIGSDGRLREWIGREITASNLEDFIAYTRSKGLDPLGENGEYHTLIVSSPLHSKNLDYRALEVEAHGDYYILKLI